MTRFAWSRQRAFGSAVALAFLCAGLTACTSYQAFHPAEKATAESREGFTAAEYDLETPAGAPVGEAKVWSPGAERAEQDGQTRTVIRVNFTIENESNVPLEFPVEQLRLAAIINGTKLRELPPTEPRTPARVVVPPGEEQQIEARFVPPGDPAPHEIEAFRVRWSTVHPQASFNEVTPFLRSEPPPNRLATPYDAYFYSPFYDPFFTTPFGRHPVIVNDRAYRHPHYRPQRVRHR